MRTTIIAATAVTIVISSAAAACSSDEPTAAETTEVVEATTSTEVTAPPNDVENDQALIESLILQRDDFDSDDWTLTPLPQGPAESYDEFDGCAYLVDFQAGGPMTAEAQSFEATSIADRTTVDNEGRLYADTTTAGEHVTIWGEQRAADCVTKRLTSNFDRLVDNGVLEGWSGQVDHEVVSDAGDGTAMVKYTIALGLSFTDDTDDTQILSQYRFQVGRATYRLNFSNPEQEYPQSEQEAFLDLLRSRAADAGLG
jgi:hypothetical protein